MIESCNFSKVNVRTEQIGVETELNFLDNRYAPWLNPNPGKEGI
jgi:hypothetical protein